MADRQTGVDYVPGQIAFTFTGGGGGAIHSCGRHLRHTYTRVASLKGASSGPFR